MLSWIFRRWRILRLYYKYYRRTGLFKFIIKNTLKLIGIILLILMVLFFLERYIIDFDVIFNQYIGRLKWQNVIFVYFISEVFFGLIPPDLFIIWAKSFPSDYLMVTYLAVLAYIAAIISYRLGKWVREIPVINNFVTLKFKEHFNIIKKWGGIIILISALFPLPFATICFVAGVMHYPFRYFILFTLARIPRFYIYAFFLFQFFK